MRWIRRPERSAGNSHRRGRARLEGSPSAPVAVAGAVFVTCGDGYLYAVRA
ncbi:PQQ-binding-like beta-propeller repeat protein [Streptomyces sp. NPDC002870]|uniref:PQQ-binding-like beta-propeller repeat protein n=1 Tax=Streptomyces sp. NPDC002870 TaxID=3364666 RepID=UPI0036B5910F